MTRLARVYVRTVTVAEEVVQETWLAAIRGVPRFEGRSSFKTWLFRILVNTAKARASYEHRRSTVEVHHDDLSGEGFQESSAHVNKGHWDTVADLVMVRDAFTAVQDAINSLPRREAQVLMFRGVEDRSTDEVCRLLGVTAGNQRVLLHRARIRLRRVVGGLNRPYAARSNGSPRHECSLRTRSASQFPVPG
jgi:RNA polymerase sigma-70 factor (ECF subfamily)